MMKLLRAHVAALASALTLVALLVTTGAPARAADSDVGAYDLTPTQAAHATCAKAGRELIATSKRDYYGRSTAFTKIRRARKLGSNVSSVSVLPSGAPVVSTDVVRCVARAQRKGTRSPMTVYYAVTLAPDLIDLLSSGADLSSVVPPAPTYSLTYATGTTPGW